MIRNNKKIAVLLWLYHTDLTQEFISLLSDTEDIFDIYLALYENQNNTKAIFNFSFLPNLKDISFYPNVGADIYSFIHQIQKIDESKYDYFIKIHSKKSKWGIKNICNWRAMLLDSLIGDRFTIHKNIEIMNKYGYGAIGCRPLIYKNTEHNHASKIDQVLKSINLKPKERKFIGGNMFMGRLDLYHNYFLNYGEYFKYLISNEFGKVNETHDGTYCHSLERIFGYIAAQHGIGNCVTNNFNIRVNDQKAKYRSLQFRHMYNQDIYCVLQPSIYGKAHDIIGDNMSIIWNKNSSLIMAKYSQISKNIYINNKHIFQ